MSSLYNGTHKCKNSIILKFLEDFDELNYHLGMVKALYFDEIAFQKNKFYTAPDSGAMVYTGQYYEWTTLNEYIHTIQVNIINISTFIATSLENWVLKVGFNEEINNILEKQIDRLDSILPPIKNSIVPSGNKLIAQINICRAIARRCERSFIDLYKTEYIGVYEIIDNQINNIKKYINRLSDYLFMLSRFVGMTLNIKEDLIK